MPGDRPLRMRLALDEGASVAGLRGEIAEPRTQHFTPQRLIVHTAS